MNKRIVTSYEEPDLDGVSSMYAYTEYLNKKGINSDYYIKGKPKKEVGIVCDLFNIELSGLKEISENQEAVVLDTNNLEEVLLTDYIYVISDSNILIEGIPIDVIQKDNIMNKAGLNLPFMVDLSVKLRDYDLVKEIEQDKERMVELLWK